MKRRNPHLIAVLQALLVTFLWSTSWVLVKVGLEDIPPITFAGLRYTLAFVCLLPVYIRSRQATPVSSLTRQDWFRLVLLGLIYYTLTQGAQFLGLYYLPAITFSLLLNLSAVVIVLVGIPLLRERPNFVQWNGMVLSVIGVVLFFHPVAIPAAQAAGFIVAAVAVLSNSGASLLGRYVNRAGHIHPLTVTVVSMGVGGVVMLVVGLLAQGLPPLSLSSWAIVGWLAVVNTAFAFTLWNLTLRTLTAMQSSIINNTMMIQIAILAWLFLDERITPLKGVGMLVAAVGTLLVQLRKGE